MRAPWVWGLGMLLWAGTASAQGKLALIAAGDCRDPDLLSDSRLLAQQLETRLGARLMAEEEIRERLAPAPRRTAEEISAQLPATLLLVWRNRPLRAEEQFKDALEEIERLPVGKARWRLAAVAHLYDALALDALGHEKLMDDAFRWVLARDPSYQILDKGDFSPGKLQRFERLRREVQAARKFRLEVKSQPSGADVYLDGLTVGKTPLQLDLVPGRYSITLGKEGAFSLQHPVELGRAPASLFVDLQFEGGIHLERAPCLALTADERSRITGAFSLGAMLGVEQVVLLTLERRTGGPDWLATVVLDVEKSQKLRQGGLRVQNSARAPEGLDALADFIMTGQTGSQVVATGPAEPVVPQPPAETQATAEPATPPASRPVAAPPSLATSGGSADAPAKPSSGPATPPAAQAASPAAEPPVAATPPATAAPPAARAEAPVATTPPAPPAPPAPKAESPTLKAESPTLKAEAPASKAEPTTPKPSAALEPAPAFAAAAPPPAEGPAWKTPVGLGLGAAGLLAGVVGGYFQLQADERWRDFNLHYAGGSAPAKDVLGQVSALRQQAESHQTIARATFVASGAALAGGVVLLLLDAEWERPGSGVAVKVSATPSSVGVNVRFP